MTHRNDKVRIETVALPRGVRRYVAAGASLFVLITAYTAQPQELIYDPEKGIVFTDELNSKADPKATKKDTVVEVPVPKKNADARSGQGGSGGLRTVKPRGDRVDIHTGRKADPPELFFSSGLEYFKNNDFRNALRNFEYADSVAPQPKYRLWIGKSLRQLGAYERMLNTMKEIIAGNKDSEFADDALFEMAVHYQSTDDYETATRLYTQLAEQYPFGTSFGSGEEFLEIAREQRRTMRAEMVSILTILGYAGQDLAESYRNFQQAHSLEATGSGNRETVSAIKGLHRTHRQREQEQVEKEQRARKYLAWALAAGAIGLVNLTLMIGVRIRIRSKYREMIALKQTLHDLDTSKLPQ